MTYFYSCDNCSSEFEKESRIADRDKVHCPDCFAPAKRDEYKQFQNQKLWVTIGFQTNLSDILPKEIIGAGMNSKAVRDYNATRSIREV